MVVGGMGCVGGGDGVCGLVGMGLSSCAALLAQTFIEYDAILKN